MHLSISKSKVYFLPERHMWSLAVFLFFFRKVRMLEILKDSQQPRAERSTAVSYLHPPSCGGVFSLQQLELVKDTPRLSKRKRPREA